MLAPIAYRIGSPMISVSAGTMMMPPPSSAPKTPATSESRKISTNTRWGFGEVLMGSLFDLHAPVRDAPPDSFVLGRQSVRVHLDDGGEAAPEARVPVSRFIEPFVGLVGREHSEARESHPRRTDFSLSANREPQAIHRQRVGGGRDLEVHVGTPVELGDLLPVAVPAVAGGAFEQERLPPALPDLF